MIISYLLKLFTNRQDDVHLPSATFAVDMDEQLIWIEAHDNVGGVINNKAVEEFLLSGKTVISTSVSS
jgi:hypothetical protein